MDACYRSAETKKWEPVQLDIWRGAAQAARQTGLTDYDEQYWLIKEEVMPDGNTKFILKDKKTGGIVQKVQA